MFKILVGSLLVLIGLEAVGNSIYQRHLNNEAVKSLFKAMKNK